MKKREEMLARVHRHYVADDCVEIMPSYRRHMTFFGNNDLMYYKNLNRPGVFRNSYLTDPRKDSFPYSSIPEHIERVFPVGKLIFTNQILDYEKPYIRVNDGFITQMNAYKDGDDVLVHTKILNDKMCNRRSKIVSREELEAYLRTGSLEQLDEEEYEDICIFNLNGSLFDSKLESEQKWINDEKERLLEIIDIRDLGYLSDYEIIELRKAILNIDEISPFTSETRIMIKFKKNGEIKLDVFAFEYLKKGKYKILLADLPVTMETLSMIKSRAELPAIKTMKDAKISLSLNPNVTREQVEAEKKKILANSN